MTVRPGLYHIFSDVSFLSYHPASFARAAMVTFLYPPVQDIGIPASAPPGHLFDAQVSISEQLVSVPEEQVMMQLPGIHTQQDAAQRAEFSRLYPLCLAEVVVAVERSRDYGACISIQDVHSRRRGIALHRMVDGCPVLGVKGAVLTERDDVQVIRGKLGFYIRFHGIRQFVLSQR